MIFLSVVRPKGGPPAAWQGPIKKIPRTKNCQIQCSGKLQKGCCTNDAALDDLLAIFGGKK
jgi:hypothetical protein